MQRLYFIVNIVAGRAEISASLGNILNEFTKADYEVTVHVTQSGTDASEKSLYACENGYDVIVCAGGDGTLSQCLQGIIDSGRKIPIGYIPAGSTNDFARTLGIPKEPMDAVRWITEGVPTPVDIGKFNNSYFSYIVAFGAFTNITYETPQNIKNIFGHSAYIMNGLMHLTSIRSKRMRIEYDGNVLEDDFIFGMVTNSASVAGLLSMTDFLLDDGVFEVILISKPANIMQLQRIIHSLLNITEEIDRDYIKFFRTHKITFTSLSDEPITWTRDGEYGGDLPVNVVENLQQSVNFLVSKEPSTIFTDGEDDEPTETLE